MPHVYLRVEAVNLDSFILDTKDLSTVRGGGLLLLHSISRIEEHLRQSTGVTRVTPISTGASSGLFRLITELKPDEVRHIVEAFIRGDEQLKNATFVVDANPAPAPETEQPFAPERAKLVARNHWRQMQSPTIVYPRPGSGEVSTRVCEIDEIRPAATRQRLSLSVDVRREFGRENKQSFYLKEVRRVDPDFAWTADFAREFEELTGNSQKFDNLQDKMALIYLDGNKFGQFLKEHCTTEARQHKFSAGLRNYQSKFLKTLLESIRPDGEWWNHDQVRLETLLWGGDEIVWIVPAWKGWTTLEMFFNRAKDWKIFGKPLTHSAAIVFCHHKAPIHSINTLAHELVELCKNDCRLHGQRNVFTYQVLESFDHIGRPLTKEFLHERYPFLQQVTDAGPPPNELLLDGEAMQRIRESFTQLKQDFPRRKLYEIIQLLMNPDRDPVALKKLRDASTRGMSDPAILDSLVDHTLQANGDAAWYHIAELWDYIPEVTS